MGKGKFFNSGDQNDDGFGAIEFSMIGKGCGNIGNVLLSPASNQLKHIRNPKKEASLNAFYLSRNINRKNNTHNKRVC